jgi:CRISPR-associated endonuclease Csn1
VSSQDRHPYVLGLDIGANSVGWACLRLDSQGMPIGLLNAPDAMDSRPTLGVRIFERGVDNYEQGEKEQTRGVARRLARQQRRQTARRARRIRRTFRILVEAGLLPAVTAEDVRAAGSPEAARDGVLKRLDARLATESSFGPEQARHQLLPYLLRTQALEARLSPYELGRALYHLAQRRGFQTNRKSGRRDEEVGEVNKAITKLAVEIEATGCRTLGAYLFRAGCSGATVRRQWTARKIYLAEFDAIWDSQRRFHGALLDERLRRRLHSAIFHQRPLRSQRDTVGLCEIEDGGEHLDPRTGEVCRVRKRRRAPECFLVSQRFRLMQAVNNLRILPAHGEPQPLDAKQRALLVAELERRDHLTFPAISELLGLPKRTKYNLQEGGEKRLLGNRTQAALLEIFGGRWASLDPSVKHAVVLELWSAESDESVAKRAAAAAGPWASLRPTAAEVKDLGSIPLSSDYMALSATAMQRLLPEMERGARYDEAVKLVYGVRVASTACDQLPPVLTALSELRNPVVTRALTELRRVVNALVRMYGKPELVRVELARDLKRNKLDRQKLAKQMRDNEKERETARDQIRRCQDAGITNPTATDILKMRLHAECGGVCPYTGRPIGMAQLFRGDVDIEHILPLSMSLDDSFLNKTLCLADVNRSVKRNRTPFQAFGSREDDWREMLRRMELCVESKRMSPEKLRRFALRDDELAQHLEQFSTAQLNDTRYASRLARRYIALLFGGQLATGVDASGRTRVQVGNGQLTALLRTGLGMGRALITESGDKRDDHRHHAIDAVATALSVPALLKRVSDHAEHEWRKRDRLGPVPAPWSTFTSDLTDAIERVAVSHRVDNRVRGALHAETLYSEQRDGYGKLSGEGSFTHKRELLEKLKPKDFERIVDPVVRSIVERHFGARAPAEVLNPDDPSTWPHLPNARGAPIPIRRVRIRKSMLGKPLGAGPRRRLVATDENHHLELVEGVDRRGTPTWSARVVPLLAAYERLAARRRGRRVDVVERSGGFQFALAKNDCVTMLDGDGRTRLFVVRGFSQFNNGTIQVALLGNTDARPVSEVPKEGRTAVPNVLRQRNCRKVTVSPIGVVRPCRA